MRSRHPQRDKTFLESWAIFRLERQNTTPNRTEGNQWMWREEEEEEEAWDSNERCSRGGKKNVSKELLTGDLEALEFKRDLVAAKWLFS